MSFVEFLINKSRALDNSAAYSGNHTDDGASHLRDVAMAYDYGERGERGDPLECMPSMGNLAKEYQKIVDPDYDIYLKLKKKFE